MIVPPGGKHSTSTPVPTRTGALLTEQQIEALLGYFPALTSVREDTTALQAGYLMGVHAVINKLRSGV